MAILAAIRMIGLAKTRLWRGEHSTSQLSARLALNFIQASSTGIWVFMTVLLRAQSLHRVNRGCAVSGQSRSDHGCHDQDQRCRAYDHWIG